MFTARPEILGTFGVVTSTHWLASAAGMAILEKGGNAFDAAVATGFALQVVEPHLNGLGGEVPIIFRRADDGEVTVLCGQGVAPAAATIDAYRGLGLDLVPGAGLLAAVVPGAFDAWLTLLRDHGTMRVADVLAPAIGYAEGGYPLVPRIAQAIDAVKDLFRDEWPSSAAVYLNGGAPAPNKVFRNPDLGRTYRRLVEAAKAAGRDRDAQIEAARDAFYRGFVAEAVDAYCANNELMDSSGERHAGVLRFDDMAHWRAAYEAPASYDYHGYSVYKTGPWGQGPVFLQQLALLAGFDLGAMDPVGAEFVHTVVECAKLAYADREVYYGDPAFSDVPMEALLGAPYNDSRRQLVAARASLEQRPGVVAGFEDQVARETPARVGAAPNPVGGVGEPTVARHGAVRGDTCHLDVIDRHGNAVSATPSGGWLQSSPVIDGLGFCLTTRGQMFWLREGLAASLAPGKRPRTTLTPGLATKGGKVMVFGTPGGDMQDQWSLIFFLHHLHHGMNLQESIEAPLFHSHHFPSSFYPRTAQPGRMTVEGGFPEDAVAHLRAAGHEVEVAEPWSIGRLCAAARDGDLLKAAATPRQMQAYALGR